MRSRASAEGIAVLGLRRRGESPVCRRRNVVVCFWGDRSCVEREGCVRG
uniref:Mating-type pheromone BAP1(2) n=1 Tax=Schizophyllum commune TaxID=5334 RepID=BAP12_SCHCO|nr:RecName: Full=Mating-type pheromone BAP1(2); Flags: Precursor [Schizophyllum commune]AAC49155.1 mating-type pheromone [Schizophyllum commune]